MKTNECIIYWDTQDPINIGWAYRNNTGSGPVDTLADLLDLSTKYNLVGEDLPSAYAELAANEYKN